jgi:hypothetical protein
VRRTAATSRTGISRTPSATRSSVRLRLLDAKRGRVVTNVSIYTGSGQFSEGLGGSIRDAALLADGSAAWVTSLPAPSEALELRYAERGANRSTLVAVSPAHESGSLAMSTRNIYWREDGVTRAFARVSGSDPHPAVGPGVKASLRVAAPGQRVSTRLASSPDVALGSLALARSFLYWRENGAPLSARIDGRP